MAGLGCSGAVESQEGADGGSGPGAGLDAGDGGSAGDATSAAGEPDPAACAALLAQYTTALAPAYQTAAASLSCASDTDCVDLSDWTSCSYGCGVITNTTGAGALSDALQDQGATTCAQFAADQCVAQPAPCTSANAGSNAAQCIAGQCVVGLPAAWVSFGIETDNGGPGVDSEPVQCNGTSCTLWRVLADGTVNITAPGGQRVTKLSAADLATADGILRDPEERQLELNGWLLCNTFSGPQHVTMDVDRYDVGTGADVSGCIASGPASSGPARLYALLQSY